MPDGRQSPQDDGWILSKTRSGLSAWYRHIPGFRVAVAWDLFPEERANTGMSHGSGSWADGEAKVTFAGTHKSLAEAKREALFSVLVAKPSDGIPS